MNEKTETPEALAAILAEMRHRAENHHLDGWESVAEELEELCDRIDAAAAREYAQWHGETNAAKEERNRIACKMRYEFAAKCRACKSAPGNAAAQREALEWAAQFVELGVDDDLGADGQNLTTAAEMARDALAAPARNCDRQECATAEGAIAALRANPCADHDFCKEQIDCAECATRWLIAPAEGGDHA